MSELTEPTAPSGRAASRVRGGVIAASSVVTVVVLAAAGFAAVRFLDGGGPQPEEALPASTLAVVSLDTNPSAGQKVAALDTLRRFPALRDKLGGGSADGATRSFLDSALGKVCPGLRYDTDVKPWLGQRFAVAAVDEGHGVVAPVAVLATTDTGKAVAAAKKLSGCATSGYGYATEKGFLLVSDSAADARRAAQDAARSTLSDDPTYQSWQDKLGERGVVNFYVAPSAATQLQRLAGGASLPPALSPVVNDFHGYAGTLRFADGGLELDAVSQAGHTGSAPNTTVPSRVASGLPADTAGLVATSVPPHLADQVLTMYSHLGMSSPDAMLAQLGITRADVNTVLGDGVGLSVGTDSRVARATHFVPQIIPAALLLTGDVASTKAVLARFEHGPGGSMIQSVQGPQGLTLSLDRQYLDSLHGGLLQDSTFTDVVPHLNSSSTVAYVDFDSPLVTSLMAKADPRTREQLAPLKALGISSWRDGDLSRLTVKLSLD